MNKKVKAVKSKLIKVAEVFGIILATCMGRMIQNEREQQQLNNLQ